MKRKIFVNFRRIILTIFLLCTICLPVFGKDTDETNPITNPITNPDSYKPTISNNTVLDNKKDTIIGTGANIAVVVSVIAIIIVGIKYIVGSVEQRADYKKTLMPIVIGIFLIASLMKILAMFGEFSKSAFGA